MIGCSGYLADVAAVVLTSDFESSLSPVLAWPAAIAEISLIRWLLVKSASPSHANV